MQLLEEIQAMGFNMTSTVSKVHCKAFEDNAGALKLAKAQKMQPHTKHINDNLQVADLFTKPLA
eukprot:5241110-Ditylum_brightwellii.AAC.1